MQGDGRFVGFDAQAGIRLAGQAWATLGLGRVDARLTATDEALPRIPPLRGTLRLDVPYGGFTLSPRLTFAGRQGDIFRGETATDGYAVFDLRGSYVWPRQRTAHIVSFTAGNLTNVLYRNHTSFIKDRAPEMGRRDPGELRGAVPLEGRGAPGAPSVRLAARRHHPSRRAAAR